MCQFFFTTVHEMPFLKSKVALVLAQVAILVRQIMANPFYHLMQAQNDYKYLRALDMALNDLFNLCEGRSLQKLTLLAKHYESSVFIHSRHLLWTSILTFS